MVHLNRRAVMAGLAPFALPGLARAYDKSVVIPLQAPHNRPWCAVAINGGPPRRFLFSTGTAENLLSRNLAADLRIKRGLVATSRLPVGPDGGERYFLRRLTVSGIVTQSPVYAHGADSLEGSGLDGVVSADLYAATGVVIDLGAGRLHLGDVSQFDVSGQETLRTLAPPARRASPRLEQFTTYGGPAAFLDAPNENYDPRPLVAAEIDGRRVQLLLDTGYPGSILLFPQIVQDQELLAAYPRGQRLFTSTYDRRFSARHVRARELRIGSLALPDPVVALAMPQDLRPGPLRIDGIVGAEVLRRLVVTFDPLLGRIWLRRNDIADQPFAYNRAGASLRSDGDHVVVDAVAPGSPAFKAGIDPGDRIVGWNGDGDLDALSHALQGPPGETIELVAARGDRRAPVKLVLAELI